MRITRTMAAVVATGALGLAAVPVLAQEATTDEETTGTEATVDARDEWHDELAAALAEELGLDTDEVATALDNVMAERRETRRAEMQARMQERLDAAVESGDLTQEQADALAELHEQRVAEGELGFGPGGGHGGGHGGFGGHGRHGGGPGSGFRGGPGGGFGFGG